MKTPGKKYFYVIYFQKCSNEKIILLVNIENEYNEAIVHTP